VIVTLHLVALALYGLATALTLGASNRQGRVRGRRSPVSVAQYLRRVSLRPRTERDREGTRPAGTPEGRQRQCRGQTVERQSNEMQGDNPRQIRGQSHEAGPGRFQEGIFLNQPYRKTSGPGSDDDL